MVAPNKFLSYERRTPVHKVNYGNSRQPSAVANQQINHQKTTIGLLAKLS